MYSENIHRFSERSDISRRPYELLFRITEISKNRVSQKAEGKVPVSRNNQFKIKKIEYSVFFSNTSLVNIWKTIEVIKLSRSYTHVPNLFIEAILYEMTFYLDIWFGSSDIFQ